MHTQRTRTRGSPPQGTPWWVAGAAAGLGALTTVLGAWALLAPRSFFSTVAVFPPYNRHLLHDAGAFQIGLGAGLLLSLRWRDGLLVALGGYAVAGGLHSLAHAIDGGLGGRDTDVPILAVLAAVALAALLLRARALAPRAGKDGGRDGQSAPVADSGSGRRP